MTACAILAAPLPALRRATMLAVAASLRFPIAPALAQPTPAAAPMPVRELAPASAKSAETFANIFTVRPLENGGVLVNDGLRRQLIMLDATLAHPAIVLDSVSDSERSYGPAATPLIPYLADSTLFVDGVSRSLLVISPSGQITRTMAAARQSDLVFLATGLSWSDHNGNLVYRTRSAIISSQTALPGAAGPTFTQHQPDSTAVVRANFETRTVDTIGRVRQDNSTTSIMTRGADGRPASLRVRLNPLTTIDEWAVLSDGTIAFVRGHDYHVDWRRPDGTASTGAKIPFDFKRLTDRDKQQLIDSVRAFYDKTRATAEATGGEAAGEEAVLQLLRAAVEPSTRPVPPPPVPTTPPDRSRAAAAGPRLQLEFVPLDEIPDYYPPIRIGAARPDLDGNLWILPTTSAQSKAGELVYDVVNDRGAPFYRVRLPVGRSVAGFGHNGVVYLMSRDAAGWHLERTTVLAGRN